mgnify:CR=1 FL=1|tara:strand:- start:58 stop:426 length:369 start_codon:yes stop_codon:yes gene_type:complete
MATNANWTVVFEDKAIVKNVGDGAGGGFRLPDASIWSEGKYSNIWAIQYQTTPSTDEVEYRDQTPNGTYAGANLGDFQPFIDLWDSAYLSKLQSDWDNDNVEGESEADKIARLGARPTSYSS